MTETPAPATAPTTNVLDAAIEQVRATNPSLAATLLREVDALRDGRKFGLVFNRHLPESVRLPNHPIKRGVKVALRNPQALGTGREAQVMKDATWRVTKTEKTGSGRVAWLDGADTPSLVDDLVVIREFGEPVYPGLKSVARIDHGKPDDPTHLVINGENHHALQALQFTHRGKVDLIYIDPPYNTGNQGWIYNDKYVDVTKGDASSKWLSFMERRLVIARELLKDTGVIIVAIGDDEHHRLRMLMDQVFGAQNCIMNAVWQGGGSALARHHAGGVDYMLIYGRHADLVPRFLDPKPFVPEMIRLVSEALAEGRSVADAQGILRDFIKTNSKKMPEGVTRFNNVDPNGMIYETADLTNRLLRPNLRYPVTDPETGTVYDPPDNGWTVQKSVMDQWVADGLIAFGRRPRKKKSLVEYASNMPVPTFQHSRNTANAHLQSILGDKRFPFPKDHEVLMRWFRMTAPTDAVILDFFGGSGTTTEVVLRLNAEDGGARQSILVTNNELSAADAKRLTKDGSVPGDPEWEEHGVFEHVTRPRISTVVTGKRPDGTTYSDGLQANVEFFRLTYLDESRVSRAQEFRAIAPLLWMQTGATGERIDAESDDGYITSDHYAVLHDEDATGRFLKAIAERALGVDSDKPVVPTVYVVTDSPSQFEHVSRRLPAGVTAHQLYEAYLRNFEINVEAR